ncbi:MAG: shikimate dehydrogenase [Actinomycetia bacterium]|nr:shikimate dehydrogenase [Actinomycetes bacterium]
MDNNTQQINISSSTGLVGLFGYPAKHSLSPFIQNIFLMDNNIDTVYLTFEFPEEKLLSAFNGARNLGVCGLNITMPYKERICGLAENTDYLSEATGSVNTIRFDSKKNGIEATGFNTDIDGFAVSVKETGCSLENKNCLVIGAGGAARSAVFAFLGMKAKTVYIYNRTLKKAEKIKQLFCEEERKKIKIVKSLETIVKKKINFNLICNCTPLGMNTRGMMDSIPVPENLELKNMIVFETIYDPLETKLIKKAKNEGAIVIDGLDMLINQAASSFNIWFGIFPDTKNIKEMVLEHLKNKKKSCIRKIYNSRKGTSK